MTFNDVPPETLRMHRDEMLRLAANLTTAKEQPAKVLANAEGLRAWVETTGVLNDRRARLGALRHADSNRPVSQDPDDDPQALINEALTYYDFLVDSPKVASSR